MFRLIALAAVGIAAPRPLVDVSNLGSVKGVFLEGGEDISAFFGLPYAKPPIGELRWQRTKPLDDMAYKTGFEARDTSEFGNCCMQGPRGQVGGFTYSEDCLYLNVYTPTGSLQGGPGNRKLPVMLWIHGGAYVYGCSQHYAGDAIVRTSKGQVVVVTINYRLSSLGFLGTTELQNRSADGSVGNFGIQDQRMAMQWVSRHIEHFGGDPNDVTIFGGSAGGDSVVNHLTQTASFPFYKKAIIQSGFYNAARSLTSAEKHYERIRLATGCTDLPCMLGASAEKLVGDEKWHWWGPVVDGKSLSDTPFNMIQQGKYNNKVPILLGSTRDEDAVFMKIANLPPNMGEQDADRFRAQVIGSEHAQKVKELYDPSNYDYPPRLGMYSLGYWSIMRMLTDRVPGFGICAAQSFSESFLKGGTPAVFTYLFAHTPTGPAGHGSEIMYFFGDTGGWPVEESDLACHMSQYWSNFAISGDPNGAFKFSLPQWPKYNHENKMVQRFQTPNEGGIRPQRCPREEQCAYWDAHPGNTTIWSHFDGMDGGNAPAFSELPTGSSSAGRNVPAFAHTAGVIAMTAAAMLVLCLCLCLCLSMQRPAVAVVKPNSGSNEEEAYE